MQLPLEGVRVVEVASFVAVPAAGALLADLGADVVKVEIPNGELLRRTRPRYTGYASPFDESPPFQMENRGKRSLVLDLTRAEARDALLRLVDRADVFITNLLPGRRRKYGLDHASLLARCPRLVVGGINGYGSRGEQADWPAFDYAAYYARTGMMDAMRDEGVPPSLQRPGVGDHAAASNLVCGILAALRLRDADGRGRYVEVSLLHTGFQGLKKDGLQVDSIPPMGAIYLTVRINPFGRRTPAGQVLQTNEDVRKYMLTDAGIGIVPFQAFGVPGDEGWFRLSVGAVSEDEIKAALPRLARAMQALT